MKIVAVDLGSDIDLKGLASEYKTTPPASWEDPVVLRHEIGEIHVYGFGVAVGIGIDSGELLKVCKKLGEGINPGYIEELELEKGNRIGFEDDTLKVPDIDDPTLRIVSFALAQSVALTRMEELLDRLEDEVEEILSRKNPFKGREATDKAIEILKVRHELISDLMILDKPSMTWESEYLDSLYEKVSQMYELGRRYRIAEKKLSSLLETVHVLLSVSAEAKGNFLELVIVVLIAIEILLWIGELF